MDKGRKKYDEEFIEEFRKSLPIYQFRRELIETVLKNQFTVITGDTGSGKTTQIPQYFIEAVKTGDLEKYLGVEDLSSLPLNQKTNKEIWKNKNEIPRIVITQPRRVAAIQMAKRVSDERNLSLGKEIGYTIRFEDYSSEENTLIKYVTDGILVRECLSDHNLSKYNIIILDEAHERSLYTDILFALCKKAVLRRNGDLRLIITSATLDTKLFSEYYNNCSVFQIKGRCYPVDIIYNTSRMEKRVENCVKIAIRIHLHEAPGHILAFLTGFEECEQACKICYEKLNELSKTKSITPMLIMPLYGAQNTEEQSKIFEKAPDNCRKVIFCTNIAETSLTVDGIGYVIDCGYVKQKIYNPKTSMDALMIVPISKVQAIQRAGRAGRTGPGKCIRLYSESFFESQMSKVTIPEILRVNLASTILTLKSMGINNVIDFEFIEKPGKVTLIEALKTLYFILAIDSDGVITKLGVEISKFPIDCCYARALIASKFYCVEDEMSTLVSLISCESVWYNVNKYDEERRSVFDKKKSEFVDKNSDHMTLLNIYKEWEFHEFSEDWCKSSFLHFRTLKQSRNIKQQIIEYLSQVNFSECKKFFNIDNINERLANVEKNKTLDDYEKINILIRMSLCQGFYMNATKRIQNASDGSYLRISDGTYVIADTFSAINVKGLKPDLLIYTELGGSNTKAVMKQVSIIELNWIADLLVNIKNVDEVKLKGPENKISTVKIPNVNDIDLYTIFEKPINTLEEQEDEEKKMKLKKDEAMERFLKRKKERK